MDKPGNNVELKITTTPCGKHVATLQTFVGKDCYKAIVGLDEKMILAVNDKKLAGLPDIDGIEKLRRATCSITFMTKLTRYLELKNWNTSRALVNRIMLDGYMERINL